ncbi:ABC-type Fe3+ transport system, permease component [Carnobacterium iners]|uniref:ABC-type Fe3+ transport system, permease component n=1 Tax=Carnobacterium iners TaxID=1073423 RepID=A0A1X7MYV8_9LACT|nr:ABC transporter permease subunit [Carnobacterium iners]SEK18463.1 ABC-type Fe3+ transport system, permease component [Carnobacterium iners]SMH29645.1 ABC-type Fe3+ transport system, permease component [Carnobacterium iners]
MKWYDKNKPYLLVGPAILMTLLLVGYGLLMVFIESILSSGSLSLEIYRTLLSDEIFQSSFLFSLRIVVVSTLLSLGIGFVLVRSAFPVLKRSFPRLISWLPMLFPHFVWGYMLYLLFSQTGLFSTIFNGLGIIALPGDFPNLFMDSAGLGIMITYIWKGVPFVILMLLPVYEQLSHSQKQLVFTLGGKKGAVFRYVEWPYVFPVLLETFFIIFSFVLAAYEVPALLGATYPKMISVLSYDWFFGTNWEKQPYAYATMVIVTTFIVFFVSILSFITRRSRKHLYQNQNDGKKIESIGHFSNFSFLNIAFLSLLPTLFLFLSSFVSKWEYGMILPKTISIQGWRVLFLEQPYLLEAILTSIGIILLALLLNVIIGIPAANALAFYEFKGKATIDTLLLSPLFVPVLAVAMGIHLTFIRLGIANRWIGVVLIHLILTLPYTIRILRAGFERVGKKQGELAVSLGAKPFKAFYLIYLPQLLPSLRSVVFIVTVVSLSQYFVTALIGGGNVLTLPLLYFPFFQSVDQSIMASFSLIFAIVPVGIWVIIELVLKILLPKKFG